MTRNPLGCRRVSVCMCVCVSARELNSFSRYFASNTITHSSVDLFCMLNLAPKISTYDKHTQSHTNTHNHTPTHTQLANSFIHSASCIYACATFCCVPLKCSNVASAAAVWQPKTQSSVSHVRNKTKKIN